MIDAELDIRPIEPGDKLAGLSLGHADFQPLKTFAKRDAVKFHQAGLARTYGAFDSRRGNKLAGYVTLVCGQVTIEGQLTRDAQAASFPHQHLPTVKLARLAVDVDYRGGLGQTLVNLAIGIVRDQVASQVGCRLIVVDAKKRSVGLYENVGFTMLDTPANRRIVGAAHVCRSDQAIELRRMSCLLYDRGELPEEGRRNDGIRPATRQGWRPT